MTCTNSFDAQNPGGEFKRKHYYCDALAHTYIEIEDDVVYDCNRWDPEDPEDPAAVARAARRAKFTARTKETP
jgi:hypothetical protein